MRAIVLTKTDGAPSAELTEFDEAGLMPGEVTIRVGHSTLNYKDGLAIVRGAPVVRRWPMIPGIDAAGVVEHSDNAAVGGGRRGGRQRLGYGREPSGRVRRAHPRARRMADPYPGGNEFRTRDGHRNSGLHGDAERAGAGTPRPDPGRRCRNW